MQFLPPNHAVSADNIFYDSLVKPKYSFILLFELAENVKFIHILYMNIWIFSEPK